MKTNTSAEALYKLTKNVIDHGKHFGNTANYPCISVEIERPETSFELPSYPLNIEAFTKEELEPSSEFPIKFTRVANAIISDFNNPEFKFYDIDKVFVFARIGQVLDMYHFNFDGPFHLNLDSRKYFVTMYKLLKQMSDKTNLKPGKIICHFVYGTYFTEEDSDQLVHFMETYDKETLTKVDL